MKTATAKSEFKIPAINLSGIRPTEFKVLVEVKEVETTKKIRRADGTEVDLAIMTDSLKEREQMAEMEGVIVAVSPLAFTYGEWSDKTQIPKPGDRVVFQKFAGANRTGKDGKTYRLINDKDIAAVLE